MKPEGLADPILKWARDHLVWSAAAIGLILLTVKLLFVADGSISVALALLQAADPKSVFLGTLLANVPLVATVLFILSGAWLGMAVVSDQNAELVALMAFPLLIISVLIMPAPVFGTLEEGIFSGAFLAFGVSYVFTQLLPMVVKWAYGTPEYAILTNGIAVYAPGSLMSLKRSAEPWLALLASEKALPEKPQKKPGEIYSEVINEYENVIKGLPSDPASPYTSLIGMRGKIPNLQVSAETVSTGRLKDVIDEMDKFIITFDYDSQKVRRELQAAAQEDLRQKVDEQFKDLRDRAEGSRLELARRRPGVHTVDGLKILPTSRLIAGLALAVVVLFTMANSEMWLPASQITLRSSSLPINPPVPANFVGYVLANDGEWTTILLDKGRSIVRVPTSSIASQQICAPRGSVFDDSIYEVIFVGVATERQSSPSCREH
jgi:hypothetical protein